MSLSAEEVLAEAAAWVWVPLDAQEVRTDEYRLVAYPAHFSEPTMALALDSERDPDALIDDVLAAAGELGRDSVAFFGVNATTRPPTLEPRLAERGVLCETFDVLARPLAELPDLDVPPGVETRRVLDLDSLRDMDRVETTVFGGTRRDDAALATAIERIRGEDDDPRWVAYLDGAAVGAGGMAIAGDVARLWGGSVLEEARGRGVYRTLVDQRLRVGRERGCRMALVKGRVETSGPVLRRAGFTAYGEERAYRLSRG